MTHKGEHHASTESACYSFFDLVGDTGRRVIMHLPAKSKPSRNRVIVSAGAVRGQIHNNSYCDVSSMAVNIRVIGRGNQAIHSGLHTISQPVPAGEMRDFKIDISVIGGRRAVVVIQDLN